MSETFLKKPDFRKKNTPEYENVFQYDSETNNTNDTSREVVDRDMKPRMSTEISKNHADVLF
jgi:hypothetical protein